MQSFDSPFRANYVLATLNPPELARLAPHLAPCLLHQEQTLYEVGDEVDYVYFPKNGFVSLVLASQTGVAVEVGLIGRDGVVGAAEVLSGHASMLRINVQGAGSGWRMTARAFQDEFAQAGSLQKAVLRFHFSLQMQTSQCVLCNRLHSVEKRLARWLLMAQDRMQTDRLELTQEFIANMLATRRVGVTLAAGALREAGLIEYARGSVQIVNRLGLETHACECYPLLRKSFSLLLPTDEFAKNLPAYLQTLPR